LLIIFPSIMGKSRSRRRITVDFSGTNSTLLRFIVSNLPEAPDITFFSTEEGGEKSVNNNQVIFVANRIGGKTGNVNVVVVTGGTDLVRGETEGGPSAINFVGRNGSAGTGTTD